MKKFISIVDDTIGVLHEMKRSGVTHVDVNPETVKELLTLPRKQFAPSKTDNTTELKQIHARANACTKCGELARCRTNVVFGVGNPASEIMFIGEAPGRDEDIKGEPFVGRAGQLLSKIIQAMGYERSDVYIANVLKCRPPENRTPVPEEIQNCLPYLLSQIELIQPKVIVALGAVALRALLDVHLGITKMRGNWYNFRGIPIMPTFHPAYLLRNPNAKRDVWQDMQDVLAKLGKKPPQK